MNLIPETHLLDDIAYRLRKKRNERVRWWAVWGNTIIQFLLLFFRVWNPWKFYPLGFRTFSVLSFSSVILCIAVQSCYWPPKPPGTEIKRPSN